MNKLRIMIAEDEYLVLMGLRAMVEKIGHTVAAEAKDGKEAVELAIRWNPDLILMDINLPVLNGLQAIRKLREKVHIPAVIITGYSDQKIIDKANEVGVFGYLVKPISKKDLEPTIEIALSRFKDIKNLERQVLDTKTQLEERKTIEKAKGIIMMRKNMDENAAYLWMQQESRNHNIKLAKLADKIVNNI